MTKQDRKNPSVVIIGAGMTGIGLVIKLRAAGIDDITVLEKADAIGGTWRENRYPGVACDVPSHAYTYSFEPYPEWNRFFADGSQIREYFEMVYRKHGVDRCTRLGEGVTRCVFDDASRQWTVTSSLGNTYVCDLLFSATGILHRPVLPAIPGLDSFAGISMHSSQWREDVDLRGKRIGVIGVGSSAVQLIPELVDTPGTNVTVFQRTPQWIVHIDNKAYSDEDKQRFRDKPARMQRIKKWSLRVFEQGTQALTSDSLRDRLVHKLYGWNARRNLKKRVRDPILREKLTPKYTFGCKRVVLNGTFYDAIQKPNAHLVTEGIERIEARGLVTADGRLHELDILVLATGFDASAFMRPMEFVGRDGLSIETAWAKKIRAYRSLCIPGFPNFFLMLGPNSPIGNYSVIAIAEMQADYCIALIRLWQAGTLDSIEATPAAMQAWSDMLRARMSHTVWTSGCNSWYLDADGDPLTWPDKWPAWVKLMRDVDLAAFVGGPGVRDVAA